MKILDAGHSFALRCLDGGDPQIIQFVKRMGAKYPGNKSNYPGTSLQECWRAEISRLLYVDQQEHDDNNIQCVENLRDNIRRLETRAAVRHNRPVPEFWTNVEDMPTCNKCGHVGCAE